MLQSKVQAMGMAKAGQVLKGLHSNFMGYSSPAKDDTCCVGCFVQHDGKFVKGASGKAITGKIAGVAISNEYVSNGNVDTNVFPANHNIFYLTKGCVAIEAKSVAKVGQYVFLKNSDGELVFNDTDTLIDHTFTGFRVAFGTGTSVTKPEVIGIEA